MRIRKPFTRTIASLLLLATVTACGVQGDLVRPADFESHEADRKKR